MVMDGDVPVVESGGATDFAYGPKPQYPPAHVDRTLHDGDTVTLGNVTLTAHKTAGHTRGCTTWTMRVHLPGEPATQLRNVVIVGSWNVNPGYRLVAAHGKPASYPGIAQDFAHTFVVLNALPCDIFLGAHGTVLRHARQARAHAKQGGDKVWIDPDGYHRTVAERKAAFETRTRPPAVRPATVLIQQRCRHPERSAQRGVEAPPAFVVSLILTRWRTRRTRSLTS